MVKDRAGQHQAIGKSYRDAHRNPIACIAEHAARRGTVKINRVADAREQCGDHIGLDINGESHVAHVTFVEDLVNRFAVVRAAMGFAHHARALGWRDGFGHGTSLLSIEAWRGAGRFAAAHLIYSRRQSGMSEEQLPICYHALREHRALPATGWSRKCFQFGLTKENCGTLPNHAA